MAEMITSFGGEHGFLSNFYEAPFHLKERPEHWWNTAEHAFQAAKATSVFDFQTILHAPTAMEAKRLGRAIPCIGGWDKIRKEVMLRVLLSKFDPGSVLAQRLIETGDAVLVEGNTWGDTYWGAVGPGHSKFDIHRLPVWDDGGQSGLPYNVLLTGHNWLGRLLMVVRDVLGDG